MRDRKATPQLVVDVVSRLLAVRSSLGDRFTDTDAQWGADSHLGPMASMQGLRSVVGAVVGVGTDAIWAATEPYWSSLLQEWVEVLDKYAQNDLLVGPYDDFNADLQATLAQGPGGTMAYTDSVSWLLSTAAVMRHFLRDSRERLDLLLGEKVEIGRLADRTAEALVSALRTAVTLQTPDHGWSWTFGKQAGSLYFTWSAIEGLSDYYDYVAGESAADLGIAADESLLRTVEQTRVNEVSLADAVDSARNRAVKYLETFLPRAIGRGLSLEDIQQPGEVEPDLGNTLSAIYLDLYLLECLILTKYDEPGGRVSPTNREKLKQLYSEVSRRYLSVCADIESLESEKNGLELAAKRSTLQFSLGRGRRQFIVRDPGLWAQFLRTAVLYRYYTNRIPTADPVIVGESTSALPQLLGDMAETDDGSQRRRLWDRTAFNLALTARGIEGLVDVCDYERRLESEKADRRPGSGDHPAADGDLAAVLASALLPHIERLSTPPPKSDAQLSERDLEDALTGYLDVLHLQIESEILKRLQEMFTDDPDRTSIEGILRRVVGAADARDLKNDLGKTAHGLFRMCTAVAFYTVVSSLPFLISTAAVRLEPRRDEFLVKLKDDDALETEAGRVLRDFVSRTIAARV